jgi:uncharacterized repeat protein (TIGR03803 family)
VPYGGAVFSLTPSGAKYAVLHDFGKGSDGKEPYASLTAVNGVLYGVTLYGTTFYGGSIGKCPNGHGVTEHCGTVFRIDANGANYAVLHSFGRSGEGTEPNGSLTELDGTLYGTTLSGGTTQNGAVFELTPVVGESTE